MTVIAMQETSLHVTMRDLLEAIIIIADLSANIDC